MGFKGVINIDVLPLFDSLDEVYSFKPYCTFIRHLLSYPNI